MTELTFREAKGRITDPYSSFKLVTSVRHISLPPRYIGKVAKGIRDHLNSELNLYCTELDGVVIGYDNIKLQQNVASIMDDRPFLHFKMQADYVVFRPRIGFILKGVVNKVSQDHIGCLVHDCFNASILRPRHHQNGWKGSRLLPGEEFQFQVEDVFSNHSVISLTGKLVDKKTLQKYLKAIGMGGTDLPVAEDDDMDSSPKKKSRVKDKSLSELSDTNAEDVTMDTDPVLPEINTKSKKKVKKKLESRETSSPMDIRDTKKTKKKGSLTLDDCDEMTSDIDVVGVEEKDTVIGDKKKKRKRDEGNESPAKKVRKLKVAEADDTTEEDLGKLSVTPVTGRKRKHGCLSVTPESSVVAADDCVDTLSPIVKKVHFDTSVTEYVVDSGRKKKKKKRKQESSSELDDSTDVNSSVGKDDFDKSVTKIKKKVKSHDTHASAIDSDNEVGKLKKKKKSKQKQDVSEPSTSEGSKSILNNLSANISEILSQIHQTGGKKTKKQKTKSEESVNTDQLLSTMLALQSQVNKAADNLSLPTSREHSGKVEQVGNKKKKKRKKKQREMSVSPIREVVMAGSVPCNGNDLGDSSDIANQEVNDKVVGKKEKRKKPIDNGDTSAVNSDRVKLESKKNGENSSHSVDMMAKTKSEEKQAKSSLKQKRQSAGDPVRTADMSVTRVKKKTRKSS